MSKWKVITGDCLEVLRPMPDASVDAVVTDPPYGIAYQSAWRIDKNARHDPIAGDAAPFVWFMPEAFRLLAPNSAAFVFCRWDTAEAFRQAAEWAGFKVRGQVVWDREHHGMGDLTGAPAPQHDLAWVLGKGRFKFPGKRPKSVIRSARLGGNALVHPTQKPDDLMVQVVDAYCRDAGTVLDPFTGSGTTGVAAVKTGRNFIGIELDEGYADIARRRISEAAEEMES